MMLLMLVQIMLRWDLVPEQGSAEQHRDHKNGLDPYTPREHLCSPVFLVFYAGSRTGAKIPLMIPILPSGNPAAFRMRGTLT